MKPEKCDHVWLPSNNITFDPKNKRPRCTMICEKCGKRQGMNLGTEYTDSSFNQYIKIEEQSTNK